MLQDVRVYCFIIHSFIGLGVTAEYREYYYSSCVSRLCQFVSGYIYCILVCPLISRKLL